MAEEKKKRVRKSAATTKKSNKDNMAVLDSKAEAKKKTSKRESDAKNRAKAVKPKRVRKAADAAKKPVSATADALTQQYHLTDPEKTGFLHKTRSITPRYVRNSWNEVRQVTWPGRKETWRLVFAVFMFAIVMGTSIAVLDYGLEKVMRAIIL